MDATQRSAGATTPQVRLNVALFDRLAGTHGATTAQQRAALMRVDRATYYRYRNGDTAPDLDVAMDLAARLGVRVDKLWLREEVGEAA